MNIFHKNQLLILFFGFFVILMSACDFGAAEDAFDDFDIIIGLDPINTVINAVIIDASDGDLVSAHLSFSGPGAASLIDAYSDPLEDQEVDEGIMTFGIKNSVVPSSLSPVGITVSATADGYFSTSKTILVTELGDAFFELKMARDNVTSNIPGTSGQTNTQITAGAGGAVQQAVTIQTQAPSPSQTQAQVTVTVPAGTVPLTASGAPLVGQITTQLRAYDSSAGLSALPVGARTNPDGTNQSIAGATFFKMSDGAGNVAVDYQSASGKRASKSSLVCDGLSLTMTSTESALVNAVTAAANSTLGATVWAYTPADGANNSVGSISLTGNGTQVSAEICIGGTRPTVDISQLGNASGGIIYTFALDGATATSGTLDHSVTISSTSSAPVAVDFTLAGAGYSKTGTKTITSSGAVLIIAILIGETAPVAILPGTSYVLTAEVATGETSAVSISDPQSGSSSLTIPSTSGLTAYTVNASMACPVGQEFDVKITSESLDAVSVFYRQAGGSWTLLPRSAITSKTAGDSSIDIVGTLSLVSGALYDFRGVLGSDTAIVNAQQAPPSSMIMNIIMSASEFGFDCS